MVELSFNNINIRSIEKEVDNAKYTFYSMAMLSSVYENENEIITLYTDICATQYFGKVPFVFADCYIFLQHLRETGTLTTIYRFFSIACSKHIHSWSLP